MLATREPLLAVSCFTCPCELPSVPCSSSATALVRRSTMIWKMSDDVAARPSRHCVQPLTRGR
jgi:hypothetical protein